MNQSFIKNTIAVFLMAFFVYFFSWFAVYKTNINTLAIQSEDTLPAMFLPITILQNKTLFLDGYYKMLVTRYPHPDDKNGSLGLTPFYLKKISIPKKVLTNSDNCSLSGGLDVVPCVKMTEKYETHFTSAFPIITPLLALPVYLIGQNIFNLTFGWMSLILLAHIAASFIMALTASLFYLFLRKKFELNNKKAFLLTIVYAFATINYSLISQALWQHSAVQLFTILILFFLPVTFFRPAVLKEPRVNIKQVFFVGLFLILAILSRPTAGILLPFVVLIFYLHTHHKPFNFTKTLFYFGLGATPAILFLLWFTNKWYGGIPFSGYVTQLFVKSDAAFESSTFEGFFGLWLSPSKGILIYSPVFIFIFIYLYTFVRKLVLCLHKNTLSFDKKIREVMLYINQNAIYLIYFAIVITHTLILGTWKHWYGGWSYGYRMASDVLPFLVLLLVPYIKSDLFQKTKKLFYILLILSILIQIHGIIFFDGIWHAAYDEGFKTTGWLWSVKNSEFVFNARRILVKLSLLDKACPKCL